VEFGPGGSLYALTFGDQGTDPDGPPWNPYSGKILRVDTTAGTMTPLVDGLTFSAFLLFDGDTAYVANNSVTIPGVFDGSIVKIENFSAIQPLPAPAPTPPPAAPTAAPPAPAPTATAPGVAITAPDTGSGPAGANGMPDAVGFALVAGMAGVACLGAAGLARRR
jgi:hypothetical protein